MRLRRRGWARCAEGEEERRGAEGKGLDQELFVSSTFTSFASTPRLTESERSRAHG